jgi:hypothetical protein
LAKILRAGGHVALFLAVGGVVVFVSALLSVVRLPIGLTEVTISPVASVDNGRVIVTGDSNVPDGSIIQCEIWHESEDGGLGSGKFDVGEAVLVASGKFTCSTSIEDWPPGTVRVGVRFVPFLEDQPPSVRAAFGPDGRGLGGPQVVRDSDGWIVQVVQDVPL